MLCAFCKKAVSEGSYYGSLDIYDHRLNRYLVMSVCDSCMKNLKEDDHGQLLLKGTSRYSVTARINKARKCIADKPLRDSCGPIWMFAKPQVDGLF